MLKQYITMFTFEHIINIKIIKGLFHVVYICIQVFKIKYVFYKYYTL